jgi:hypothetical protein
MRSVELNVFFFHIIFYFQGGNKRRHKKTESAAATCSKGRKLALKALERTRKRLKAKKALEASRSAKVTRTMEAAPRNLPIGSDSDEDYDI